MHIRTKRMLFARLWTYSNMRILSTSTSRDDVDIFASKFKLNIEQKEAVEADLGVTRVHAGPGSGKTMVIAERVRYMVNELGIPPQNILCFTFTNKAAKEMQTRIHKVGGFDNVINVRTMHSFCVGFLRRWISVVRPGTNGNFRILDKRESLPILNKVLETLNVKNEQTESVWKDMGYIKSTGEHISTDDKSPRGEKRRRLVEEAIRLYNEQMIDKNLLNFDDLILETLNVLTNSSEACKDIWSSYPHVLIDESQDINMAQLAVIRNLCFPLSQPEFPRDFLPLNVNAISNPNHNPNTSFNPKLEFKESSSLFTVGDHNQAIYGFRGAGYHTKSYFEVMFPSVRDYELFINYRSSKHIIQASNALLQNSNDRIHPMDVDGDVRSSIPVYEVYSASGLLQRWEMNLGDLEGIIRSWARDHVDKGLKTAILYRTSKVGHPVDRILGSMPRKNLSGRVRFTQKPEIRRVCAGLHLISNSNDELALEYLQKSCVNGLGDKGWERIRGQAQQFHLTVAEFLLEHAKDSESAKSVDIPKKSVDLGDILRDLIELRDLPVLREDVNLEEIVKKVVRIVGYDPDRALRMVSKVRTAEEEEEEKEGTEEAVRKEKRQLGNIGLFIMNANSPDLDFQNLTDTTYESPPCTEDPELPSVAYRVRCLCEYFQLDANFDDGVEKNGALE
ncbi:hypothetical protein AAMO2058_000368800 [Amorphochlora amoebiformis]